MNQPKVTFGIVNCNRLHYLRSCLESLLYTTETYTNKEIIVIDNASVEKGTSEYLDEKELQGIKVVRMKNRDPSNEFAIGLNTIFEMSTGDYICPLQGDMQFVLKGDWLEKYISYFEKHKSNIGCIALDAQRKSTIQRRQPFQIFTKEDIDTPFRLFIDSKRPPIGGAADCIYSREILEKIYPWNVKNINHEGGQDSETAMLQKVESLLASQDLKDIFLIAPQIPVSVAIWTDRRGTNARVRGNKRYGDYWPPKEDFRYYKIYNIEDIEPLISKEDLPVPIENMAQGVGWSVPKDENGVWLKNPIRPETASPSDWTYLEEEIEENNTDKDEEYLKDWLEE